MNSLKKLPRFIHQCMTIGEIPTSYKVSLTYEEQLMWFCRFLEEQVLPVVNNNSEVVQELKTFVENYFDNLDVQEEINNKLEDMLESGELQEIITEYLQMSGLLCYNTKSDMKGATNLIDGSFAKTYGETTYNDGRGEFYKIREIQNTDVVDDINIIALTNFVDLIAERIPNIKEYPIYSTDYIDKNAEDNTAGFQVMLNLASVTFQKIIIKEGTYKIKSHLVVKARNMIEGIGKVVLDFSEFTDNTNYCIEIQGAHDYSKGRNTKVFENITFKGYNSSFGNTAGDEYINKNLFFITGYEFILDNIKAYGFNNVFTYGSNSYIISVINSHIGHNNRAIYFDITAGGYSNSGERLSFKNTTLCNNNEVIYNNLGMFSFEDCSIDYNGIISSKFTSLNGGVSSGRSIFSNCHIEDALTNTQAEDRFIIDAGRVYFIGCEIWVDGFPFIKATNSGSNVVIDSCEIRSTNNSIKYLVDSSSNNVIITNYTTISKIAEISLSKFTNAINPNMKELATTTDHGSVSFESDYLQLNSEAYANGEITSDYIAIPKGRTSAYIKYNQIGTTAGSISKNIAYFYDTAGNSLGNIPYNFPTTTDLQLKSSRFDIPANATKMKIKLFCPALGTSNYVRYSDVYIGFN